MSRKPESQFITSVHKHFPTDNPPHWEKNWNPYRGGTPDVFYSGELGCMWVEYKYVRALPKRGSLRIELSELQKAWLRSRHNEGRHVAVVVGHPKGGIVFQGIDWDFAGNLSAESAARGSVQRASIAAWIYGVVGRAC